LSTLKVNSIQHSNGTEALTIDSAGNTSFSGVVTGTPLANRNLIINGDMRINQRGDTTGANGSGYFGVDRWNTEETGLGTYDVEQDTDVPTGQGFSKSLKISLATTDTVASGDFLRFMQRIEGQNLQHLKFGTSSAENITLSFWIKSNLTGTYALGFQSTDGVSTNRVIGTTYTIDSADTWEKKTLTFVGDTAQVIRNDNNWGLRMFWWLVAGDSYKGTDNTSWIAQVTDAFATGHNIDFNSSTSNYINITGVQLEVGDTATPFEHRPYDMELARCQRYYNKNSAVYTATLGGVGYNQSTTTARFYFPFPVTMRDIPSSLEQTGTASDYSIRQGGAAIACNGVPQLYSPTPHGADVAFFVSSGLTSGQGVLPRVNAAGGAYLAWSAEL